MIGEIIRVLEGPLAPVECVDGARFFLLFGYNRYKSIFLQIRIN